MGLIGDQTTWIGLVIVVHTEAEIQRSLSCIHEDRRSQRADTGPVVQKHRFNVASSPRLT